MNRYKNINKKTNINNNMSNISDFKGKFTGGGARPNLFQVIMDFPGVLADPYAVESAKFLIKAASLPSSVVGEIPIGYRGRKLKIAGDRTFENWTVTVYNDVNMQLRNKFEGWMELINANESNTSAITNISGTGGYYAQPIVQQLDRAENVVKTYNFVDMFPVHIQDIPLDFDTNDAVEEFTVEFAYQYWISSVV